MGKKYIIELEDNESVYKTVVANGYPMIQIIVPAPYTAPDLEQVRKDAFKYGYQRGMADANRDGEYNADDGWYVMQKISLLPNPIKTELFGTAETAVILQDNSFKDALDKLTEYEQEKEEQIQVGDEVVGTYTGEEETEPFVIIRKIPEINPTYYFGIYSKSGEFCQGGLKLKKTGRHFPEIAEVLQKMKEA